MYGQNNRQHPMGCFKVGLEEEVCLSEMIDEWIYLSLTRDISKAFIFQKTELIICMIDKKQKNYTSCNKKGTIFILE